METFALIEKFIQEQRPSFELSTYELNGSKIFAQGYDNSYPATYDRDILDYFTFLYNELV